ncbi:Clock-controlled protein 6 [Tolypocladium paradoxum]|uniref:Clock-controlled protein 6 n=1 Tax=Tolypocladium paradoxum TaxID=94208 RepID=A0A2S4L9U0_9HYPO|nr:Clock-controlled protein 6 [Tolypocladium paradoxum]
MKFTAAAVLAAAAGAYAAGNATVVTEVVDVYTTYCPGPTQITHGSKTYTVTKATTLTITDCPCTITKPVITSSVVACKTSCGTFTNSTAPIVTPTVAKPTVLPTGSLKPTTTTRTPSSVPTAGAGKAAALSGAGLAGFVGLAAFVL